MKLFLRCDDNKDIEIFAKGEVTLKKFISVIVVGMLLLGTVPVMAATNSLIGQKVQGLFAIEKGGKKVADAVIINGVAYAPVKAVADATGASLTVEGKKIIMADGNSNTSTTGVSVEQLNLKRAEIVDKINELQAGIKNTEEITIPQYEKLAKELANNGTLGEQNQATADSYKKKVEEYKQQVSDLQKQLDSIDAQIAELQK
ncbi:hypothetical protein D3C75_538270 [compost metagenome]